MKFINVSTLAVALLCCSYSMASDVFTATPHRLWQIGKNTLKNLSLHLHYTKRDNRHAEGAQKRSMDWIKEFKIITDPEKLHKIDISNFATLIGKAHPNAKTEDKLTIAVLFCTWLFIYDDVIEKQLDEKMVIDLHARSLEIINETAKIDEKTDSPLNKGLNEIMKMMRKEFNPSPLWKSRFLKDVNYYFDATLWELKNRKNKKFPTLEDYQTNRQKTGATWLMFDLMELFDENPIPEEIFATEYFKAIRSYAADLIDGENDIGSLFKEKIDEDFHNLVIVHMANKGSSYEDAFEFVGKTLKKDLAEFEKLSQEIPVEMHPYEAAVGVYLNSLWQWVAANHYWAADSARYNPPEWINSRGNILEE